MKEDENSVLCAADVGFNAVCLHINTGVEGEKGILGQIFGCAAVGVIYKFFFIFLVVGHRSTPFGW